MRNVVRVRYLCRTFLLYCRTLYRRRQVASLLAFERLADCLTAGIDLTRSVQFLAAQSRGAQAKIFTSILAEVNEGRPITPALNDFVDSSVVSMFRIAEQVGVLPTAIKEFVKREREKHVRQSQLVRALAYPLGLLVACMGLVIFVQLRVQPELRLLGVALHAKANTAHAVWSHIATMLPWFVCMSFIVLPASYASVRVLRKITGRKIMPLPFDILMANIETENFVYILLVQLRAGLTYMDAFEIGISASKGRRRELHDHARRHVLAGNPLSESLHPRLSPLLYEMVAHGELTGEVEKSLTQTRAALQESIYRTIGHITRLLEPLLMSVMGTVVLASMYSVFAPMYAAVSSTVPN